jgi:Zn-dependent membrane protease YugP
MAAGAACVAAGSFLAPVIASAGLLCCQVSLFGGLGLVLLERDASRRGLRRLVGTLALADEVSGEDLSLVRAILDAAALTYLAAPFEGLALLGKVFASG